MANADKVWQGLSASDIVGRQCCCKPLNNRQLIEVLKYAVISIDTICEQALCGNNDSNNLYISTRPPTYYPVESRCEPFTARTKPHVQHSVGWGGIRQRSLWESPTDSDDGDDHSDLVIVAEKLWL